MVLTAVLVSASTATAQQPTPRIGYVYPAGGRQGSTFQVTVGGQALQGVNEVHVSGTGVEAKVVEYVKPLTPQQANSLRDKLKELQERKRDAAMASGDRDKQGPASTQPAWTDDDEKTLAEIRKKLAGFVRRPANPAIAETVTVQVTMAPDAEPGPREIRLSTPAGLTDPLVFCVGQLPEVSKPDAKTAEDQPPGRPFRNRNEQEAARPTEMSIALPAVVNGQIMPGGVDRYRFKAHKGQRLVVHAAARELIPYLADAVPGWFQATLALYDAKGKELAYDDDYRFHPDPVLSYMIPADGEYLIEIKDAVYRGREDFVYRITVGELPFVTSMFPLGSTVDARTTVDLKGWNLPVTTLTPDTKVPGIHLLSARRGRWVSNQVPFLVDPLPDCLEREPNNSRESAQPVTLPIIVNGRIDKPGDWDVFRFEGGAGDKLVTEVYARRLDSPVDSVLKLTDANGRQLAFNDDHEDKGSGLSTHHADSWLRAALPAAGTYYLQIGDAQNKGGPEYAYRLRISPPRPDFELRIVPSSISVRAGGTVPLTVYALREDGFSGEITVVLKDSPAGFTLGGARVPAGQDQVRFTLTVPPTPQDEPLALSLQGRATIQGREVVRPAVPAEDMMQAFAYRHLVPAQELLVTVSGRWIQRNPVRILSPTPVRIPLGGTTRVRVGTPRGMLMGVVHFELSQPPDGIVIQSVSPFERGSEIVLRSDATKVKTGLKGNLIVDAFAEKAPASNNAKAQANKRRVPIGTLPAVPFEIVAK
jgi:hypothetical protein